MPNWCATTYVFAGNTDEITMLSDKITEWTSKEFIKTDFNSDWLGNVLYGAGLQDRIDTPESELRCRGSIMEIGDVYEMENGKSAFDISTETAWVPMAKMWEEVIKKLDLDSVRFAYEAEEPGCELYWIYDPDNLGVFDNDEVYVDLCIKDRFFSEYGSKDWAVEKVGEKIGVKLNDFNDLIAHCNSFNSQHDDGEEFVCVHEFERINSLCD